MQIFYKKVFRLARLAGKILLESNAEEHRVEDTTLRIMQTTGLDSPGTYSNTTGLFLSLSDTQVLDNELFDIVRINHRSNNIQRIDKVNEISRAYVAGQISVDEAYHELKHIEVDNYEDLIKYSNCALIILFVILFGGNLWDLLLGILVGGLLIVLESWRQSTYFKTFTFNILAIAIGTVVIKGFNVAFPNLIHMPLLLGASIMPFYPVTSTTNCMRDILKGNNLAGLIKAVDAGMTLISITIGFTLGLMVSQLIFPFLLAMFK